MRNKYSLSNRLIAFVLSIVMLVGMMPVYNVLAADDETIGGETTAPDAGEKQYGEVTALTGGTVNDPAGKDVTVTLDGKQHAVTLEWAPVDEGLGRNKAGWWAGIQVAAPELTNEQMQNVRFRVKDGEAEWSDYMDFVSYEDDAENHYLWIWIYLTPELLEAGEDLVRTVRFWWQGTEEPNENNYQTVTFRVRPGDGIKLVSGEQTDLRFVTPEPGNTWVGGTFRNDMLNAKGNVTWMLLTNKTDENGQPVLDEEGNPVLVEVTETDAAVIAADGTLTFKTIGAVTVRATAAGDTNYLPGSVEYTVTAIKADQNEFKFANGDVAVTYHHDPANNVYGDNTPAGGMVEGQPTYRIVSGSEIASIDAVTGVVTYTAAGTVVIEAVLKGNEQYTDATATYTLTINQGAQAQLSFKDAPNALVWQSGAVAVPAVEGGSGTGMVRYIITSGDDVATLNGDGTITLNKTGTFVLTAIKDGDSNYEESVPVSTVIRVDAAAQAPVAFGTKQVNVTFGANNNQYTQTAVQAAGGSSSGEMVYSIVSDGTTAQAQIDAATGTVTFATAGDVVVKAVKPADNRYMETSDTYVLTVAKADQTIAFANGAVNAFYGADQYLQELADAGDGEGKVTYAISENTIGASVDSESGMITFTDSEAKVGQVTVTATKQADACYNAATASYTLTLDYLDASGLTVSVTGNTLNTSGWYTGNVALVAPEGFQVAFGNALSTGSWAASQSWNAEGTEAPVVYLKDQDTGAISDAITLDPVSLDTRAPGNFSIEYQTPVWEDIMERLFGLSAENVIVTIKAEDANSGIASLAYSVDGENYEVVEAAKLAADGSYSFTLSSAYRGSVSMKATDHAGWTAEYADGSILVIDPFGPGLTAAFSGEYEQVNGILYTAEDFAVTFTVTDENYDLRAAAPVVLVNGKQTKLTWQESNGSATATLPLNKEGDYVIHAAFTDRLNRTASYEVEIRVDKTPAEISADLQPGSVVSGVDGRDYYDAAQNLNLSIREHNFAVENVTLTVTATEAAGEIMDYSAYAANAENWISNGDTHTLVLPFDVDANYTVTVGYGEQTGKNDAQTQVYAFTVDTTVPRNLHIKYQSPSLFEAMGGLFGFSKDTVTVTVSAEDFTAGIASLEYSLDGRNFEKVEAAALTGSGTYSFDIATNYRGMITLRAYDRSGLMTELREERALVVDLIRPGIEAVFTGQNAENNGVYYTAAEEFAVTFTVSDANYDLRGSEPVVKVNGEVQELTWTEGDQQGIAVLTLTEEGKYTITADFNDRLHNAETYTLDVVVDRTRPGMSASSDEPVATVVDRAYYNEQQVVTITIDEQHFNAEDVEVTVVAKQAAGEVADYTAFAKDAANWTISGTKHTLALPFNVDANYTLDVDYTDMTTVNAAEHIHMEFTVDTVRPEIPVVTYSIEPMAEIIETLSLGFFKAPVDVTVTAKDNTAGVKSFTYSYVGTAGTYSTETVAVQNTLDGAQATFTIEPQFRGTLSVTAQDHSGWNSKAQNVMTDSQGNGTISEVVVDNLAPTMVVTYTGTPVARVDLNNEDVGENQTDSNSRLIYKTGVTANLQIEEMNFDAADVEITVYRDGQAVTDCEMGEWLHTDGTALFTRAISLKQDGDYQIEVSYTDKSDNGMSWTSGEYTGKAGTDSYKSNVITIDTTVPVIDVTYDIDTLPGVKYCNAFRNATITVTDRNFRPGEVSFTVAAVDAAGRDVDYSCSALNGWSDWTEVRDGVWQAKVAFDMDANYIVHMTYADIAGHVATPYHNEFTVDTQAPEDLSISYSTSVAGEILKAITFGYYQADVTVTLSVTDKTAGIQQIGLEVIANSEAATDLVLPEGLILNADGTHEENGFIGEVTATEDGGQYTYSFNVPAQFNGEFRFTAMDKAHNATKEAYDDDVNVVVDNVMPDVEIAFEGSLMDQVNENNLTVEKADAHTRFVYDSAVTATITVKEANFYSQDLSIVVTRDGKKVTDFEQTQWVPSEENETVYTKTLTLAKDGDYEIAVSYTDRSGNEMTWSSTEYSGAADEGVYVSNVHTVDTVMPVLDVRFTNYNVVNGKYFNADRTAIITVTDRNFRAGDVALTITDVDAAGLDTAFVAPDLTAAVAWTEVGTDQWQTEIDFDVDANYTMTLDYQDLADHQTEHFETAFTVDKVAPQDLRVVYETKGANWFQELITELTAGVVYFGEETQVTLTAADMTSGVQYIKLNAAASGSEGATNVELPKDLVIDTYRDTITGDQGDLEIVQVHNEMGVMTVTLLVPGEFRGEFFFEAVDMTNWSTEENDDKLMVVDTIAPGRTVEFVPTSIVSLSDMKNVETVEEGDQVVVYYNKDAVFTFKVEEANFHPEDVKIQVNGKAADLTAWENIGQDKWQSTLTLTEEGEYVITAKYTDRSGQEMAPYTSQKIVIDKTAPVIDVEYGNTDVKNVIDGREYYAAKQTATITILDRNFRADDVQVKVTAKDAANGDVLELNDENVVAFYADLAKDPDAWTPCEGGWYLELTYAADANYTFDIAYRDLATNVAADYEEDAFTVDTVIPETPVVTYSTDALAEIIETLSLGFFKAPVNVKVTATDSTSGVHSITYSYTGMTGEYASEAVEVEETTEGVEATFTIEPQFRGTLSVTALDRSGLESKAQNVMTDSEGNGGVSEIVVDELAPEMEVVYEGTLADRVDKNNVSITEDQTDGGSRLVYSGDVTATVRIKEENFDAADVLITVYRDGQAVTDCQMSEWTEEETGLFTRTISLQQDGDYRIEVSYNDKSGNSMSWASGEYEDKNGTESYQSNLITIDTTAPVIDVTYDNVTVFDGKYYAADRTATITVTDRNFRPGEVVFTVTAVDAAGQDVGYSCSALTDWNDWTKVSEEAGVQVWQAKVAFDMDANYTVGMAYADIAGNQAEAYSADFTVDTQDPENLTISYSKSVLELVIETITFGYYQADATVTLEVTDKTAGIKQIGLEVIANGTEAATDLVLPEGLILNADGTHEENGFIGEVTATEDGGKYTYSFQVPAQFNGEFRFTAMDMSRNSTDEAFDDVVNVVVDDVKPDVQIVFEGSLMDQVDETNATVENADDTTRFVYDGTVTATITVKEANFYSEDVTVVVTRDGEEVTDFQQSEWIRSEEDDTVYTKTLTLEQDGDYEIAVSYTDRSGNEMTWTSTEYTGAAGEGAYASNVHTVDTVDPAIDVQYTNNNVVNDLYYDDDRTAIITVTDRNFRADEVVLTITDVDAAGQDTAFAAPALNVAQAWTQISDYQWQTEIDFDVDANYTMELAYQDMAKNEALTYSTVFTVDKVAPTDLDVIYEENYANFIEELISDLTFGVFYFGDKTKVTLTATDVTSGLYYIRLNAEASGSEGATTMKLPKNLVISSNGQVFFGERGDLEELEVTHENGVMTVTFLVPGEFRGEFFFEAVDKAALSTAMNDEYLVVVDTIAPGRTVHYEPTRIVTVSDMKDVDTVAEGDEVVMYYNQDAVVTFEVKEANFYPEDIEILVNGETAQITAWELLGDDTWQSTLTLVEEGDYVITAAYTDRSGQEMTPYTSQRIVIDKTAPVVTVEYGNTDVKNVIEGREYFADKQNATITIVDRNFRADDVKVLVSAKDAVSADVLKLNEDGTVESYAQDAADDTNWTAYEAQWRRADDTYVLELLFDADANYTFDIVYEDLAANMAADYAEDAFTVDATAPTGLAVSYSTSVLDRILESITFGYYNATMTVTISANDQTSSVYHYAYSYINAPGVSSVNAELLDQAIAEAEITYDGYTATASFEIPKLVLRNDNQFNGTVSFTAYDRAENSTDFADTARIIVDNISPTATITYNQPVRNVNGTSYYAGAIQATISITEANFDSADVVVSVTREGSSYPVRVAWRDNSTDSHVGTFTLDQDGDYVVNVSYSDKSGNKMATYTSNRLTLDKTDPTIHVSSIVNNSANKADPYSFVITVDDTNLDVASVEPVLSAVVQDENGVYSRQTIKLDTVTVAAGKTYTYSVEDLPQDALYTLTCVVSDMSGNVTRQMMLEDGQLYEQVQFSVNRNGSVFAYGDDNTEKLIDQYYVYDVENDVLIEEVNVDPIEDYKVTLNGKALVEGVDYVTTQTSKNGEWSKRTYVISKDLFAEEGEYSLIVTSTDKAESVAYSDIKNLAMSFVVDRTAPMINMAGLETGGRYQTAAQSVTLIPTDEGGRLSALKVIVLDSDGNPLKNSETGEDISVRFDMSGAELLAYLEQNDGKASFTVPEGLNNQVQIICTDCAMISETVSNEYNELFKEVTVSQNQLVIFYANTEVFYGTIGGTLALAALIIFLLKRKKKNAGQHSESANA